MDNTQIAHDLAIAKLNGNQLSPIEMISEYKRLNKEFLDILNSESEKLAETTLLKRSSLRI